MPLFSSSKKKTSLGHLMESHRMFSTLISFWVLEERLIQVVCETRKKQQSCPWSWSLWRFPSPSLSQKRKSHSLFWIQLYSGLSPCVKTNITLSGCGESTFRDFESTLSSQWTGCFTLCETLPSLHGLSWFLLWHFHEELDIQQL